MVEEVAGETIPVTAVDAHLEAVTDNPDGTVTVTLLVERISVSHGLKLRAPAGDTRDLFTNYALRPSGDMPVRVRLGSREVAETLDGLGKIGKEVITLISDIHRLLVYVDKQERGKAPPREAAYEFGKNSPR